MQRRGRRKSSADGCAQVCLAQSNAEDLSEQRGDRGGEIIAQGTPEEVARVKKSYTGEFLKKELN